MTLPMFELFSALMSAPSAREHLDRLRSAGLDNQATSADLATVAGLARLDQIRTPHLLSSPAARLFHLI